MQARGNVTLRIIRVAAVVAAVSTLGGCFTISERAWANGGAMSQSRANYQASSGDMSLSTHKQLRTAASPLSLRSRDVPYPPFGFWW